MVYGAILAGGVGKRMENQPMPKQFLPIGGEPVIIRTLVPFLKSDKIDAIYVAVHKDWIEYAKKLFQDSFSEEDMKRITIVPGGKERLDSFENIMHDILDRSAAAGKDILICHEAARPFLTLRMIEECVAKTEQYDVAATFFPINDTIFLKGENDKVVEAQSRRNQLAGQTPSGFRLELLQKLLKETSETDRSDLTSTTQLFLDAGIPVPIIQGDALNFKITTNLDLAVADQIIKERLHE